MDKINLQDWFEDRCKNKPNQDADRVDKWTISDIFMNELVYPNGEWKYKGNVKAGFPEATVFVDPIWAERPDRMDFQWWIFKKKKIPPQLLGFKLKGGVAGKRRRRTIKTDEDGDIDLQKVRDKVVELYDITIELAEEKQGDQKEKRDRISVARELYQHALEGLDPGCNIDTKINGKVNIFFKNITDDQALEILEIASRWERTHGKYGRKLKKS